MKKFKKRAQSTVEYILLMAAVIGVLIVVLAPGGIFHAVIQNSILSGASGMLNMSERVFE